MAASVFNCVHIQIINPLKYLVYSSNLVINLLYKRVLVMSWTHWSSPSGVIKGDGIAKWLISSVHHIEQSYLNEINYLTPF